MLDVLSKIDKRNGVTDTHKSSTEDLKEYVESQIREMRLIITRNRVDILLNEKIPVDGRQEKEGRDRKISELEATVTQMVEAINVLEELKKDLQ